MAGASAQDPIWKTTGADKRAAVQRMFGEIAPTYDRLNGLMTLSMHKRWRAIAVSLLKLKPGDRVLDVCCGTGDFIAPLRAAVGPTGVISGIDFSGPMLKLASAKTGAGVGLGDACRLPVRTQSVKGVTVGWGIRNVPDIDAAHAEIFRVLKTGGRFVSIDMAKAKNALIGAVSHWTFNTVAPFLGRLYGKGEAYTYLPKSTDRFMTRDELAASMRKAGFSEVGWKDLCFGNICIHHGVKP